MDNGTEGQEKETRTELAAPGPTAITVASGKGLAVTEEGRKIPEAVFFEVKEGSGYRDEFKRVIKNNKETNGLWLESLDEHTVKERDERLDAFESGGLEGEREVESRAMGGE